MNEKPQIRVRVYPVLEDAVERGVSYGYHRAFKHTDKPDEEAIKESICQQVMNELCEALIFDDEENT